MKTALLTLWYSLALLGYVLCGYKVYPLVWPYEPIWFVVVALGLIGGFLGTLTEILKLYTGDEK